MPASVGGGTLVTERAPVGFPMDIAAERLEEFSPGLDPDLLTLVQATAELELQEADDPSPKKNGAKKAGSKSKQGRWVGHHQGVIGPEPAACGRHRPGARKVRVWSPT